MFEDLSQNIQEAFRKLRGHGKLTDEDITKALKDVRMALLSADVNYKIVRDFEKAVKERALGTEILSHLTPAQSVIKIVDEELAKLMGGKAAKLNISSHPPTIILMVGLQGSGKTTSAAKLAMLMKRQGKRPALVAADIYRPAAIKQLQVVGEQAEVPVFTEDIQDAVQIAKDSLTFANKHARDTLIIDTAGRLQIDERLMQELKDIKAAVNPHEILLVVDSMIGQEAVNVAETFHKALGVDGIVLTKLDGDARGGAALSIKAATGCPIKFVGMGEKLEALEIFHPDRMASRILGMGDVLSLIEKAQSAIDAKTAEKMVKKIKSDEFTLQDFLEQLQQVKKLGSLNDLLGMVPGLGGLRKKLSGVDLDLDGKEVKHMEAIILSMTPKERADTSIIDAKRRKRIALGSGTKVADVNKLLKQFDEMRKMMRKLKSTQAQAQQQQQASKKSKAKKGKLKKGKNTKVKMPTLPNLSGLLGSLGSKFPFGK
ncbi:MAG: signal recognition particle protein [Selenomonadaceae bacterium]|nr:signal recognition particle protein [Selenomonadaceae bacterium]